MIGAKSKSKIVQRNKRLAIRTKVFNGNESGAWQGSVCKNTNNSSAYRSDDENKKYQSNCVPDHDLTVCDSEPIYSSVINSRISVLKQDTPVGGKEGLCVNKYRAQSPVNSDNVVHGTVFTTSDGGGNSTLPSEGLTTVYRCLQPFGFIKKVENISKYYLKDFSRSVIVSSNNERVKKVHKILADTDESNYKSAWILVKTDLNLKLWAEIFSGWHLGAS